MRSINFKRLRAWLIVGFTLSGLAAPVPATAEATSPEDDGWELVFSDAFDRDELGDDWQVAAGEWELVDGAVRGTGFLFSAHGIPSDKERIGYQRMAFHVVTDVKVMDFLGTGANNSNVRITDIDALLHATAPPNTQKVNELLNTGYFFQFGGYWNTQNQLRRARPEDKRPQRLVVQEDPEVLIERGKRHHIVVENDTGHLRMFVDGKLVLEHEEQFSAIGAERSHVGFYFSTRTRLEDVKVYVKPLPNGDDKP